MDSRLPSTESSASAEADAPSEEVPLPFGEQRSVPLRLFVRKGEDDSSAIARCSVDPSFRSGLNVHQWVSRDSFRDNNPNALIAVLADAGKASKEGTGDLEAMLAIQSRTLDVIFNELSRLARMNITQPEVFERFLRLAFKAQSQSRATVESLAEIKNPRSVAFIKQANVAQGHQQVNNGQRARENANDSNELFDDRSVDGGAPGAATTAHPALEAMAPLHGAAKRGRKDCIERKQSKARRIQR